MNVIIRSHINNNTTTKNLFEKDCGGRLFCTSNMFLRRTDNVNIINAALETKEPRIIQIVAQNVNTPEDILDDLSYREESYIRDEVARNKNTRPSTLVKLLDDNEFVKHCVIDTLEENYIFDNVITQELINKLTYNEISKLLKMGYKINDSEFEKLKKESPEDLL